MNGPRRLDPDQPAPADLFTRLNPLEWLDMWLDTCHDEVMTNTAAIGWDGPVLVQRRMNNGRTNGTCTYYAYLHLERHRGVPAAAVEYASEDAAVAEFGQEIVRRCGRCAELDR